MFLEFTYQNIAHPILNSFKINNSETELRLIKMILYYLVNSKYIFEL